MLRTKRQKRQALFLAKETIRHKQIDFDYRCYYSWRCY